MCTRGWNPLNKAILVDPDILATSRVTSTALVPVAVPQLNSTATSNDMVMYHGGRPMPHVSIEQQNDASTVSTLGSNSLISNTNSYVHPSFKDIIITEGYVGDLMVDILHYTVQEK